jgi:hypothetical protein
VVAALLLLAGCTTPLPPEQRTMYDGIYGGVAEPTDRALPGCGDTIRVSDFLVHDGVVTISPFNGPIAADSSLFIGRGPQQLVGRFSPGRFDGQVSFNPVCVMNMQLTLQQQ